MKIMNGSESAAGTNPMLLKIRHAALNKAFTQIREKRFNLDESRTNGWISEEEYQKELVNLILEGNKIRMEQKQIEEYLKL